MSDRETLKLLPGGLADQEDKKQMLMAMIMSNTTFVHEVKFVDEQGAQVGAIISLVLNIDIEEGE